MIIKNLRFRSKLFIGFTLILLFAVLISVVAYVNMNKVHQNSELIYKHPLAISIAVRDVNIYINSMHRSMKDVALAENGAQIDSAVVLVNGCNQNVLVAFDLIFERFLGDKKDVESAYNAFIG